MIHWTGKRTRGSLLPLVSALLVFVFCGSSLAQGNRPDSLQAYALRGPQDTSAMLYLSALTNGASAPQQFESVTVSSVGSDGQPQALGTFTNIDASSGQATIDIGDVALGTSLNVHATVGHGDGAPALNATTAVTEFAVNPQSVVVPDFSGFGAQMNMHLYTALNDPTRAGYTGNTPPVDLPNIEQKVKDMKPGLSRIFLSPANYDPANQNRMDSFYKTVELAQAAGAKVNITWWFLEHSTNATTQQTLLQTDMQEFAGTLQDLIVNYHLTCVQQITIQNEPNSVGWLNQNKDLYKEAYSLLDGYLRADGIRDQIHFVGGDLVLNFQKPWLQYMAANMSDLLDGWSVHIYWNYWDPSYFQGRLSGILSVYSTIPAEQRKPLFVTEYGVRGVENINSSPIKIADPYRNGALVNNDPGVYLDASGNQIPVSETNIVAFQQAWFNMLGANDGFTGFSKWDFYHAQYDFGYQDYSLIGYLFNPAPGQDPWPLRPAYYMEWLMANSTGQHWQVLGVNGSSGAKLISPFRSPSGDLTLFALSTDQSAASFTIGNLPRGTELNVLAWNADGSGQVSNLGTVNASGTGTVTVNAPGGSMLALTTLQATGWHLCRSQNGPCVSNAPSASAGQ